VEVVGEVRHWWAKEAEEERQHRCQATEALVVVERQHSVKAAQVEENSGSRHLRDCQV